MRTIPALALSLLATTLLTGCAGGPADAAATVDTTAISHTDFAARLGTVTDNTVLSRSWENLGWTLNLLVEHGMPRRSLSGSRAQHQSCPKSNRTALVLGSGGQEHSRLGHPPQPGDGPRVTPVVPPRRCPVTSCSSHPSRPKVDLLSLGVQ